MVTETPQDPLSRGKAPGFDSPTKLPDSAEQARQWQEANRSWWESSPMRYDWDAPIGAEIGTEEYFTEIDRRFFESSRHYLPWTALPFERLIEFGSLRNLDVLEIGVGHGSHARLIAPHCRTFTGIDLTERASTMTAHRLAQAGIAATIARMDAEEMTFSPGSFDWIWSWGVIHHSSNTARILGEMHRVLRPGGRATVMVYYRSFWHYYVHHGILRPLLRRLRGASRGKIHEEIQQGTDGAIARYYRMPEWRSLCSPYFEVERFRVLGQKSDAIPLPAGALKRTVGRWTPDFVSRVLTNRLRMGSFLVAEMRRRDGRVSSGA